MRQRSILILMSDTGGGHRASAQAIQAGFQQRYGDRYRIEIIDLLMQHLPWPLCALPKSYSFLANDAPGLWKTLWKIGERPFITGPAAALAARWAYKLVSQAFSTYAPDLIISVHPLVQEITLYTLARLGWSIPFVTVVTDLATAHPLWFHPAVTRCYVASEEAQRRAHLRGLQPEQVRLYGLPVRPIFAEPQRLRAELRRELGLSDALPVALVMGGGEGAGPIEATAAALAHRLAGRALLRGEMVVVCGRNQALRANLAARTWPIPAHILGFVDNMPAWMAASDCLVTKAGPGTIAEALICGLPLILNGYIPGQEEGNVTYVVDNRVGRFSEQPEEIAAMVEHWFGDGQDEREEFAQRSKELGRPQATFQIVEDIAALLEV